MDKPKKKPTEGRKRVKRMKDLKTIKAILDSPSFADAYAKLHPKASRESARRCAQRMVTPEVVEEMRNLLALDPKIRTNRATVERFLYFILAQYFHGDIKASDGLRAIELLSKLVPDFKDRIGVEDLSALPEKELDQRLKRMGVMLEKDGVIPDTYGDN